MSITRRNTSDRATQLLETLAQKYPDPTALLYAAHPNLVRLARGYGVDNEDLVSLCWVGAAKAASKFRNNGGASFPTYASLWMRGEVRLELRRRITASNRPPHLSIGGTGEDGSDMTDQIAGPDVWDGYERDRFHRLLSEIVNTRLPPIARDAVAGYYGLSTTPMSEEQVCQKYGMSPKTVRKIRRAGEETVRKLAAASE